MILLKPIQDFLILELGPEGLKYLYYGFDHINAEILDQGRLKSENCGWPGFLGSLKYNLNRLRSDILPPQKILEAFIVVPEEMTIPFRIIMPYNILSNNPDMHLWELNQIMTEDTNGYSALFKQYDQESRDNVSVNGLAVRNSILDKINSILKENSIHLSGMYLPHELWQELDSLLPEKYNRSAILYKSDSSCMIYHAGNGAVADLQRYPLPQDLAGENGNFRKSLHLISENISYISQSGNPGSKVQTAVFEGNFGYDEIDIIQELLGDRPEIIRPDDLGEELNPRDRWEYLPALVAGKKSAELYMQKLNI